MKYTGNALTKTFAFVSVPVIKPLIFSWSQCANWCASEPGCKFWTYDSTWKTCYAKTSDSGRETDVGKVSGPVTCNPPGNILAYEVR